jgi:hypothetical protein
MASLSFIVMGGDHRTDDRMWIILNFLNPKFDIRNSQCGFYPMRFALGEISLTKLSHVDIELSLWDSRFSPIIMIGLALWWNLIDDASMGRKGVELYHG